LSAAEINDIARAGGFKPMSVCLSNDHSVQMNDPKQPPNKMPWCTPGEHFGCWKLGIPIFTRIAPRKGYIISPEQFYCDKTPCQDPKYASNNYFSTASSVFSSKSSHPRG